MRKQGENSLEDLELGPEGQSVPDDAATAERKSRFTNSKFMLVSYNLKVTTIFCFAGSAIRLHPLAPPVQQEFDMHFCALPEPNSMPPTGRSETVRQYFQRLQDKYRLGEATLTINTDATIPQVHAMLIT